MFALIILNKVMIFDLMQSYGFYELEDANLEGYFIIENYKLVLEHYKENYFDSDISKIEKYSDFMFQICVNYVKDLYLY